MFFNTNTTGGANTFPFANASTSRKVQWFIPPNTLGAVSAGNNITDVYFQAGNSATGTYPILTVKLKTGSGTGLTGVTSGPVESGMTTVYTGANVNITCTTNNWFKITLQTPFLYNPALPLIVEVEHNATSSVGPYVIQALTIPGPGAGRQWADYNAATLSGVGGVERVNFGIDVLAATPCTATPGANTSVGPTVAVCPNASAQLGLATTYSFGGITYQWQSSTLSAVGPFSAISGATSAIVSIPNLTVATWFNAIITCTNTVGSITTTAGQVSVSPVITTTAPYFESFEGIGVPNKLPNCSWAVSNMGTCQTYTSSNTLGRIPHTGNSFAVFYYTPAGANYFYTNGIYLTAGITYSAALWYETEYYGYNNFTDLSILYGTTQTPTGLVSIVSTNGPAVSNVYKSLSNTFTVPASGLYYVAVKATAASGSAQYLTWDDLAITIPCTMNSPNKPNLSLTANTATICAGDPLNLSVTGADTYTWNTGSNALVLNEFPASATNYNVMGTNTLTGCMDTASLYITVNSAPVVLVVSNKQSVCLGSSANLQAIGASATYVWNTGGVGSSLNVSPTVPTTYTVLATGTNGCVGTAVQLINVLPLPTITASSNRPNEMCPNEIAVLTGAGSGVSYEWISSVSSVLVAGNPVNVSPSTPAIYTVTTTDANGCQKSTTVSQNVVSCTGLTEQTVFSGLHIYPNPTSGEFSIASDNTLTKTVEVIDITGKIVYKASSSLELMKLDIGNLSHGIYYVKIQSNSNVEVIKIVKQ